MYGLLNWQFWASAIWFVVAIWVSWYVPGSFWLKKRNLTPGAHYLLSLVLGLVLWAAQAYILGYANVRWLTYVYLIGSFALWLPNLSQEKLRFFQAIKSLQTLPRWPLLLIIAGSVLQLSQVITTGLEYQGTIGLFRINAYDGVLHLAFIQALVHEVPAEQPGATGLFITNYHYWSDLIVAELARIWHLPIIHLFFQFMPIILSVGTGVAVWQVVKLWGGKTSTIFWCLALLYLAGDLAYVFTLLLHQDWGAHVAAIDNGATQLLNIPHSYAKLVFITALFPLTYWFKNQSRAWGFITILLIASLVGLKVYFGIFAAFGLAIIGAAYVIQTFHQTIKTKQSIVKSMLNIAWLWQPYLVLGMAAAAIYLPANKNSGGLLWAPLEWPKLFVGLDHINWPEWWLRKQVYDAAQNWRGIFFMDALAIGICLLSVFGTRLLGFVPHLGWYKKIGWQLVLFLSLPTLIFIFLGLYTLQTSGLFNVFNFFAVAAIPLALMTGFQLDTLWQRRNVVIKCVPIVILLIGLPRLVLTTSEVIDVQKNMKFERAISPQQQEAFSFLRTQVPATAVIQSHPANEFNRRTPAVAFFSNRPTFLTGISMLESHNQPIAERQTQLKEIFASTSSLQFAQALESHHIDYLYLDKVPDQTLPFTIEGSDLKTVFENSETIIYKTR